MNIRTYLIIFLLVIATVVRLDNIGPRTEFLGDQGGIAVELSDAFMRGVWPLSGPLHSNGIHSGPLLYYFFAPAYLLFHTHVVGLAVFMALLGVVTVYLVFLIGEKIYGKHASYGVAFIYAVSPYISSQSRAIWTPAFLPFFISLLIFSIIKIIQDKQSIYMIVVALCAAVLSQMYIPSLPTVAFFSIVGLFGFVRYHVYGTKVRLSVWLLLCCICFIVIWLPFWRFEQIHDFIDLRNFVLSILAPVPPAPELASTLSDKIGLLRTIFRNVLPIESINIISLFGILLLLFAFFKGKFWGKIIVCWFFIASLPILTYKGPIFEHYVASLILVPFLLLGFIIRGLLKINRYAAIGVVGGMVLLQLSLIKNIPIYNDISRTEHVVDEMIRQSNGRSFSFTLLTSRSFSDYHYRYFFKQKNVQPQIIYEDNYLLLFLICENQSCTSWEDLVKKGNMPVLCYEKFCQPGYPLKRTAGWEYDSQTDIENAHILTLRLNTSTPAFEKR